jgi:hydrocephalus-inducing protein
MNDLILNLILFRFYPTDAKTYKNEAFLSYDNMEAYITITGQAHSENVYLSKTYIQMEDAYIGLQTQQTLQIVNKSHVKVDFQWRAFATEKEETEKKNRLRLQLEQEEAEEKMLLKEIVSNEVVAEEIEIEDQDDSEEEERDEKALMLKRQKKAELLLSRKYKNIRKAIEDDLLLFQDDIFSIEPQSGQIWPNSEMTVTVTFLPRGALHYSCTAFCNISCQEDRLPMHLAGEGIGPKV